MAQCIPKTLVASDHLNISICSSCERIGLCYKNLLSNFSSQHFTGFAQSIIETAFETFSVPFPPNGEERIVIKTCHNEIQFSFNCNEFSELKTALQQALLLLEIDRVLK